VYTHDFDTSVRPFSSDTYGFTPGPGADAITLKEEGPYAVIYTFQLHIGLGCGSPFAS
jgi:hypothetical protein